MEHHFLDRYSELDSPVHRLDPRVKFLSLVGFIVLVVSLGPVRLLSAALWLALLSGLIAASRIPPLFILKRSLVVIPFVLVVGCFIPFLREGEAIGSYNLGPLHLSFTRPGLEIFFNLLIKAYLSILALVLLTSATRFSDLALALEKMRFPRIVLLVASFMYRYVFVIADEMMKMEQGRKARQTRKAGWRDLRVLGQMIGMLFIRSFERGERVYQAMLARGFSGRFSPGRELKLRGADLLFFLAFTGAVLAVGIWG